MKMGATKDNLERDERTTMNMNGNIDKDLDVGMYQKENGTGNITGKGDNVQHIKVLEDVVMEKSLFNEIDCAMREILHLRNTVESLRNKILEMETENATLKAQALALSTNTSNTTNMTVNKLLEELKAVKDENKRMRAVMAEIDFMEEDDKNNDKLRTKLRDKHRDKQLPKMKQMLSNMNRERDQYVAANRILEKKVSSLQRNVDDAVEAQKSLRNQMNQIPFESRGKREKRPLRRKMAQLLGDLEDHRRENKSLQRQIEKMDQEQEREIGLGIAELESERTRTRKLEDELESANMEVRKLQNSMEQYEENRESILSTQRKLHKENTGLLIKLQKVQKVANTDQKALRSARKKVGVLEVEMQNAAEAAARELQSAIIKSKEERDIEVGKGRHIREKLKKEHDEILHKYHVAKRQVVTLKTELKAATANLKKSQSQSKELRKRNQDAEREKAEGIQQITESSLSKISKLENEQKEEMKRALEMESEKRRETNSKYEKERDSALLQERELLNTITVLKQERDGALRRERQLERKVTDLERHMVIEQAHHREARKKVTDLEAEVSTLQTQKGEEHQEMMEIIHDIQEERDELEQKWQRESRKHLQHNIRGQVQLVDSRAMSDISAMQHSDDMLPSDSDSRRVSSRYRPSLELDRPSGPSRRSIESNRFAHLPQSTRLSRRRNFLF